MLDTDRSGDIEKHEFELYARVVMRQLEETSGNVEVEKNAGDAASETGQGTSVAPETDEDEIAFGDFQRGDGNKDSSWQLLESYWSLEEPAVRRCVHDFGAHDNKFNLVLLDKLLIDKDEDGSVAEAWRCFRELCAFASRLKVKEGEEEE